MSTLHVSHSSSSEICVPKEYWEDNRPSEALKTSPEFYNEINKLLEDGRALEIQRKNLKMNREQIENFQLKRIHELVQLVWDKIPVYRNKYEKAGITQDDIHNFNWEVYKKLPIITKEELIAAFPLSCINPDYKMEDLFPTRSSGSSGKTLLIRVDPKAIVTDTWQGIRQFELQTSGRYTKDDLLNHIYTVPWWVNGFSNGNYTSNFISSLISPEQQTKILENDPPVILSLYPSNLQAILPYIQEKVKNTLQLVVVHSEQSSQEERNYASKVLGVPVLDEYSSEELTRIALQLPDGKYYLCEDTVRADIIDPNTGEIVDDGKGVLIGTNLLNTAMPFIKYLQGDVISIEPLSKQTSDIHLQWRQIQKVEGRKNDSFIREDGLEVPAGTLLDVTYRWMFDVGINIEQFEILQIGVNKLHINLVEPTLSADLPRFEKSKQHFIELLSYVLGSNLDVTFDIKQNIEKIGRKRRPIRREFNLP